MVRSGRLQVTLYKSDFRFSPASFSGEKSTTSNIDGYRTAIADKSGNDSFNISKDENLNRLLDSFIGTNIQRCRGIPSWNLSLVIYQLTKLLFEHLSKASVKHLTFKTVFLLALGSGKQRHAWLHKALDTRKIGLMTLYIPHPASYLRISWPVMDWIV